MVNIYAFLSLSLAVVGMISTIWRRLPWLR